jgi:RecA/RadA recombinase
MKASTLRGMSQAEQVEYIKKGLGFVTFSRPPKYWLKTGSRRLNAVLGSRELGIPYGKILTLAGEPSSGKTLMALRLMGKAQQDGATVGWVDVENSFDAAWARTQGLDPGDEVLGDDGELIGYTNIALFQPSFGTFGQTKKEKKQEEKDRKERRTQKTEKKKQEDTDAVVMRTRLQTAEELLDSVEKWMILQRRLNPDCKIALGLDSTTALQPAEEMEAGMADQNMRTRLSLAPLLNLFTKDMVQLASNTNAFVSLISQLRQNPSKMFGDPRYVPGGNGVLFYPSMIAWMRRVRNMKQDGRIIGLESIISNRKNKAGAGSVEYEECGAKMQFNSSDWEFVEAEEMKKREK